MKKLIISVILIVIFGGTAAYFGLVSKSIPENSIGIIFSKLSGFRDTPVVPGKLTWLPDALLPTNVTVYLVPNETYSRELSISDELPNSGTYSEYLDQQADFSWRLALNLRYKLRPEALPALFREEGLRPETYVEYINSAKIKIDGLLLSHFKEKFSNSENFSSTIPAIDSVISEVRSVFSQNFPNFTLLDITVSDIDFPDFDLYFRTKEHYLAILSNQTDKLVSDIQVTAEEKSTQTIKLELLKRYGELFTKYPVLVDFLAIDSPNVNKLLPKDWN